MNMSAADTTRWLGGLVALAASLALGSCDAGPVGPSGSVANVVVSPATPRLEIGATQQLSATVEGPGGDTLQGKRVVWESQDPGIAEVSSTGMVRALATGTTQIAASAGGQNGIATLTVVQRPVAGGQPVGGGGSGTGVPGQPLPDSLAVRVIDTAGQPVAGVEVTWTVTAGGGSISPSTSVTGADGIAKAQWTLGPGTGEQTATAQAAGFTVGTFTVTAQAPAPPPPAAVASVEVTPASGSVAVGGALDLNATARDAAGNVLTGRALGWRSANADVATVDGQGRVVGVKPGTATIIATVEGKTGTAQVTVLAPPPVPVASVAVQPGSATLVSLGATRQFTAVARDANGNVLAGAPISWTSSNPGVAQVNSGGLATAVANGTATITARSGDASGTATLTVSQKADRVSVTPLSASLVQGASQDFDAAAFDANGRQLSDAKFVWKSSNSSVAEVNSAGLVTAKQPGNATITATTGGTGGAAMVTVTARPPAAVASVEVKPSSATISAGASVDLDATARDAAGNVLTGRALSWRSENTAIAEVDGKGKVTGRAAGSVAIVATVEGVTGTASITVTPPPPPTVSTISVEPGSATLAALGITRQFTATARDADGNVIPGVSVAWSSSRENVAEINSDGLATSVGNGTTSISARAGGVTGTATLTVEQRADQVVVSPSSATLREGESQDFDAAVFDSNDRRVNGADVRWSSSNGAVAEVSSTGRVTAKQPGSATITATADGASGSAGVTVNARPPEPVASVDVSPASGEIDVGGSIDFDATPRDASGNALDRPVAWRSSDPAVATVNDNGRVTGVAPGSATITATSEGASGSARVTVRQPPPPPTGSPTLRIPDGQQTSFTGDPGDEVDLTVLVVDSQGNPYAGVPVSWNADDGGSVDGSKQHAETTNSRGESSVTWKFGGKKNQTVTASLPDGQTVAFTADIR